MSSNKKITDYVSDIDLFLQDFDKKNPGLSKSQQKEIAKFQRIYRLRDDPDATEQPSTLWDAF